MGRTIHGANQRGARTPEYKAWCHAKDRCHNPNNKNYDRYGARGVTMCEEWRTDFSAFIDHVGPRLSDKHTLDRYPNGSGNYEPGNVRWATMEEQSNNRSTNRLIEFNGVTRNVKQWAEHFGISRKTLVARLNRGMAFEDAVSRNDFRCAA